MRHVNIADYLTQSGHKFQSEHVWCTKQCLYVFVRQTDRMVFGERDVEDV